jgi:hypothetical protein
MHVACEYIKYFWSFRITHSNDAHSSRWILSELKVYHYAMHQHQKKMGVHNSDNGKQLFPLEAWLIMCMSK